MAEHRGPSSYPQTDERLSGRTGRTHLEGTVRGEIDRARFNRAQVCQRGPLGGKSGSPWKPAAAECTFSRRRWGAGKTCQLRRRCKSC
jgi:hypothetical protein